MPDRRNWQTRPPEAEWLSITRYAQVYGVSRVVVRKWIAAGLVPHFRTADPNVVRVKRQPPDDSGGHSR